MIQSFRMDVTQFHAELDKYIKFTRNDLVKALLSSDFTRDVKIYLTSRMLEHIGMGESLKEGDTLEYRGQFWRGWAFRYVLKYGQQFPESTRWRWRKYRHGVSYQGPLGRGFYRRQKMVAKGDVPIGSFGGRSFEAPHIKDGPAERVWNFRKGGSRYSESSLLQRDRGSYKQSIGQMKVSIDGNVITFSPGSNAAHFRHLNRMRPVFVFAPEDLPFIMNLARAALQKLMVEKVGV